MSVETMKTAKEFGLEVTESLVWQAWEPGREYTKMIVLKNINPKTKKVKYRIPKMKYFITKYPQPIMLGSGTSVKLPVTFRPINKEFYEDTITFQTQGGQFVIPMKALLPESKIVVPQAIHFGMAAVKDQTDETFEIQNLSNVTTSFYFDKAELPFSIAPSTGTVLPKGRVLIKASFKPEAAKVYSYAAWCTFEQAPEDQRRKVITFQGIGKFPYLCLKTDSQSGNKLNVDFGRCSVGKERFETVEIVNMTPVNAAFQLLQTSHGTVLEQAFTCSQYHGTIPKTSSLSVKISFKSNTPGMVYADDLKLCTIGTPGTSTIKCIAASMGPDISVKIPYVNFGVTTIGKPVTRSFQISNSSDCGSIFEFENDNRYGAFQLDMITGELKPNSSQTVIVTFVPRAPINYYKKLVCLVHNQEPVFVHLFGTCHSEDSKPEVLRKVHLERYEINAQRGITRLPPEELQQLKEEGKVVLQEDGTFKAVDIIVQDELHTEQCTLTAYEEYFNDDAVGERPQRTPHVSSDIREIDFGRCLRGESYHKSVSIANHTKGKVTCRWMAGPENAVFSIWPEELDIKPLSSASFQFTFKPTSASQFFDARLEGYAYFKSMRDHRLVKDYTFCPPWCLNVTAFGHTFPERVETFVPKCKWGSSTMIFPPVSQSSGSYKSMLLTNVGENPLHFEFETSISSVFSCKPSMGLCRNQHKLVIFRMLPSPPGVIKEIIKRKVNAMEKYSEMVTLIGTSEGPAVEMNPKDVLYFKPTCVGARSPCEVTVKNITRIPLKFCWVVPKPNQQYFIVENSEGMIEPLETQTHIWSFLPDAVERHICKVSLVVSNPKDNAEVPFKCMLRLTGEGQIGSLSVAPKEVDFGKIVIGTSAKREIKVLNNSDCTLHYRLQARQTLSGPYGDDDVSKDAVVLELDHDNFALPARAKKALTLTVCPWRRVQYSIELLYELLGSDHESGETCVVNVAKPLCIVRATGVYPSVNVSDLRGTGCLMTLSKARLWELLSIDRFNKYLDGDPSKEELRYAVATRHSTRRRMPVNTRAVMDFDFNSAPHGAEPSIFHLCLENGGASDVDWSFLFPTDLQLEMEYWSQTGQFDDDELHEMFVMDNQLFSIHPRRGVLSPGGIAVVIITYSHTSIGVHKLPVLFKISRGREIVLNFIGTTLDTSTCHLHFSSYAHIFTPLAIGNVVPPIQRYQLFNGGAQTVRFQLDLSALENVQKENFNWKVLECLTPSGQIFPGSTFDLLWIFAPLEPKMYTVDIPVHVQGGESALLTFTGVGYDPNLMGPTMTMSESATDSIPASQKIPVEEQLLYLSEELLDFGNVPLFARSRKILYMENKSSEYTVSFNWKLTHGDLDMVIQMEPDHGYIEPQGKRMCKVTFYSESFPAIYDVDITCEVVNETEMERYNREIIKWHQCQEEKRHLFTITEKTLALEQAAKQSKQALSGKTRDRFGPSEEKVINRFNALPPIGSFEGLSDGAVADFKADPIPWPPRSFLVHLNVKGRTFTLEEFNTRFTMLSDFHFPKRSPRPSEFTETPITSSVTSAELETLEIVLKTIVRDVIVAKDFKGILRQIHGEPVPYFGMLNTTQQQSCVSPFALKHNQPTDAETSLNDAELDMKPAESSFNETVGEDQVDNVNGDTIESKKALDESSLQEKEMPPLHVLKRSEEVRFMLESLIENTIFNILSEASHGEISLTARPRFVGLPPSANGKLRSRTPQN